ncbi:hypothetical protein PPL_07703 [Heterostelium album PN500]|uniref:B box-type domain-containing protein n=1 Tax=Heterostelium pallidum (strain ATCC 26659 / Pp 5 / PN500) TaxID=670386 RepID=D3BGQ1_HETP5|nr:hypothetical protein PPL_07703 [Heterostelium album PN500]EFA79285.1 hypothetical protein PPL_07703 [Heterostelium album PN500]|eukprot:XP_020431406.1 hypothetical protein PPL_07703 [Heterostelium album PN500]
MVISTLNCKTHSDQIFILYCEDCNCLICSQCLVSSHQTHQVLTIQNLVQKTTPIKSENSKLFFTPPASTTPTTTNPLSLFQTPIKSSLNLASEVSHLYSFSQDDKSEQTQIHSIDLEKGTTNDNVGLTRLNHNGSAVVYVKSRKAIYFFGGKHENARNKYEAYYIELNKSDIYPLGKIEGEVAAVYDGDRYVYLTTRNKDNDRIVKVKSHNYLVERFDTARGTFEVLGSLVFTTGETNLFFDKSTSELLIYSRNTLQKLAVDKLEQTATVVTKEFLSSPISDDISKIIKYDNEVILFGYSHIIAKNLENNLVTIREREHISPLHFEQSFKSVLFYTFNVWTINFGRYFIETGESKLDWSIQIPVPTNWESYSIIAINKV